MNYKIYSGILFLAVLVITINQSSISLSYDTTNVTTRVNITESYPVITNITINGGIAVDLNEGSTKEVICQVTIRDYNGYLDINLTNATMFDTALSNNTATDDNNLHYTNSSCVRVSNSDAYTGIWNCSFNLQYYSNNGSWTCHAQTKDQYGFTNQSNNTGTINALYAINLTSQIDYGNMAVGDTSATSEIANVTNFGNMNINISVYGYGGDNESVTNAGDYSFLCEQGNITIDNEKYGAADAVWGSLTSLTNTSAIISGLTILQQTNDSLQVINQTYWRLYVPPNPFGQCNGTVVFEAQAP